MSKLLDRIKYTNTFSKYTTRFYLPLLSLKTKKHLELHDSINPILDQYKTINVLASGPSLNKCDFNRTDLYVTTNSSYLSLSNEHDFVHIIRDAGYLKQFLMFGLKYTPKLIIIEALYTDEGSLSHMANYGVRALKKYLGKRPIDFPILITGSRPNPYFEFNELYIRKNEFLIQNKLKWHDSNSGITIYSYALWWAVNNANIKQVNVFGIDAGEGGNVYFDGQKTKSNHVAMKDVNKMRMGEFFDNCQSTFSFIKNYSYFRNNTD